MILIKQFSHRVLAVASLLLACASPLAVSTSHAVAPDSLDKPLDITFCIYDPMGSGGDASSRARDLALDARKWNIHTTVKVYTDERVAAEDFKAGMCDGLVVTTLRARQFNKFMGSLDAVGAIRSAKEMRAVLQTLANPKLLPLTISGPYQVIASIPLGAAYVFVNDRSINSIEKAAGKKVAVLDWDKSQAKLVQQLGAQPVASDITNFASKFNNGQVDILIAPAIIYKPFELYRGLGTKGAIFRYPMIQITASIVINRDRLLKKVPDMDVRMNKMRTAAMSRMEEAFAFVDKSEKEIDAKYWLDLTPAEKDKYSRVMHDARLQLVKDGTYDAQMMSLLKRVRCKQEPTNYECALKDE